MKKIIMILIFLSLFFIGCGMPKEEVILGTWWNDTSEPMYNLNNTNCTSNSWISLNNGSSVTGYDSQGRLRLGMPYENNLIGFFFLDNNTQDEKCVHNVTYNSGIYTSSGKINGAYSFNTTTYILVNISPNNISMDKNFTVVSWIYPISSTSSTRNIWYLGDAASSNDAYIAVSNTSVIALVYNGTAWNQLIYSTNSSSMIKINEWRHIAVTWSSAEGLSLYIDGGLYNSTNSSLLKRGSVKGKEFRIAKSNGGTPSNSFNGSIDELMIFNRSLSKAEINTLYNSNLSIRYNSSANMFYSIKNDSITNVSKINMILNSSDVNQTIRFSANNGTNFTSWLNSNNNSQPILFPVEGNNLLFQINISGNSTFSGYVDYFGITTGLSGLNASQKISSIYYPINDSSINYSLLNPYVYSLSNYTLTRNNQNGTNFNGINSTLTESQIVNLTRGNATISLWVSFDSFQDLETTPDFNISSLFSIGDQTTNAFVLRFGDDGLAKNTPQFIVSNGTVQIKTNNSNRTFSTNTLMNIIGIVSGNRITLYVNNTVISSNNFSGNFTAAHNISIGRYATANTRLLNGSIYKITLWNKALNNSERAKEYSQGPNYATNMINNLVLQYLLNKTETVYSNSTNIFNVNKTDSKGFYSQKITQYNTSAYNQSSTVPCYVLTNNGSFDITVMVSSNSSNNSYVQIIKKGLNNISETPSIIINSSTQDFINLSSTITYAYNQSITLLFNKTVYIGIYPLISIIFNNSLKSSDYTINYDNGSIILTNSSYDTKTTVTAENIYLIFNNPRPLAHDNLNGSITLELVNGTLIPSSAYSINYYSGTINLTNATYNYTGAKANYTYYSGTTYLINYTYYAEESVNVSCFGNYINATLNNTWTPSIDWSYKVKS